jgi:hypothetical protein
MRFMQDLPPRRIYDKSTLTILAELENKGTSDLSGSKCMVHLHGYDDSIIRGIDENQFCGTNLWAKSVSYPEGGRDTVEFKTDRIDLPEGIDSLDQKFIITSCYEYETFANPVVCVNPQLYQIQAIEEACVVRDVPLSGGQGAPVSISRVEVDMISDDRVAFKIHVDNVGGGTVLRPGISISGRTAHSCPFNLDYDDYNVIEYDVDMSGASLATPCSPSDLRLVNNDGTIFCTFRISGDNAYTTPLQIRLKYNYMDSIYKDVEIIKTPE